MLVCLFVCFLLHSTNEELKMINIKRSNGATAEQLATV